MPIENKTCSECGQEFEGTGQTCRSCAYSEYASEMEPQWRNTDEICHRREVFDRGHFG